MITDAPSVALDLLSAAAAAAADVLPVGETLEAGIATRHTPEDLGFRASVLVPFTGAVSGELALAIDDELADALLNSTMGPLDLAQAIAPATAAIGLALGHVTLGVAQAVEAQLATSRINNHADTATVVLSGATRARAAVLIGLDGPSQAAGPAPHGVPVVDRLDLLRGVEMQASVELGRARMTLNDLLSLRSGAVIELDRAAGDAADLCVNGRLIARGEIVVVDENYGLRITYIVNDETGR